MEKLILRKPSKELEDRIWDYRQEYFDFGEKRINGSCGLHNYESFDEWLNIVLSLETEKQKDKASASTFFMLRESDNKVLGSVQLRHFLTPELEKHGGHIGYSIRPSERQKGYGKQQLLLVLDVVKQMKIPEVMISCNKDNIASSKTIISCGGRLICENLYNNIPQQIFWVSL